MTANPKQKEWKWNTPSDRRRVMAGSLGSLAVLGFGVSQLFNPLGLIIMGAMFLASAHIMGSKSNIASDPQQERNPGKKGLEKIIADLASNVGLKQTPRLIIMPDKNEKVYDLEQVLQIPG